MCGIVGYVGPRSAQEVLLRGLEHLEYRGYDSAGIAVVDQGEIQVSKAKGRLQVLSDQLDGGAKIGGGHFMMIAGPCSVESEAQITGVRQMEVGCVGDTLDFGSLFLAPPILALPFFPNAS